MCGPGLPKTLPTDVAGRNMEFSYYRLRPFGAAACVRNTEYGGVRNSEGAFQCKLTEAQSGPPYFVRISEVSAIGRCPLGEVPLYTACMALIHATMDRLWIPNPFTKTAHG